MNYNSSWSHPKTREYFAGTLIIRLVDQFAKNIKEILFITTDFNREELPWHLALITFPRFRPARVMFGLASLSSRAKEMATRVDHP